MSPKSHSECVDLVKLERPFPNPFRAWSRAGEAPGGLRGSPGRWQWSGGHLCAQACCSPAGSPCWLGPPTRHTATPHPPGFPPPASLNSGPGLRAAPREAGQLFCRSPISSAGRSEALGDQPGPSETQRRIPVSHPFRFHFVAAHLLFTSIFPP